MSWTGFAAVFAAFFLTHSLPLRPLVKARLTGMFGARGFGFGYSALSFAMLALLIWSAGQAPVVQLWPQALWHRHIVQGGMLLVCLILALAIARPNPFSFGGAGHDRFDPAHPGLIRWTRHPVLLALALWAGLHLLPNGDLAHVILFTVLGGFAVIGRKLVDRRKRRDLGEARWHNLYAATTGAPLIGRPDSWGGVATRLGLGLLGFIALLWAHPFVIGVSAL